MYRAKPCRTAAPLWFRRWSRSRAAVFRSLGKGVAIGHLSTKVLASLERKTTTLLSLANTFGHRSGSASCAYEPDDEELPLLSSLYAELALQTALSPTYCAVGGHIYVASTLEATDEAV